jgi:hypothetical protein
MNGGESRDIWNIHMYGPLTVWSALLMILNRFEPAEVGLTFQGSTGRCALPDAHLTTQKARRQNTKKFGKEKQIGEEHRRTP